MGDQNRSSPKGYFQQSADLLNSFILVLPLLVIYQAGLLLSGGTTGNGADLFSRILVGNWGWSALIWVNLALVVVGVVGVAVLSKKGRFDPKIALPVVIESTVYAFLCGFLITYVMSAVMPAQAWALPLEAGGQGLPPSVLDRLCLAIGAGVNEEFVFRLGMFGGLTALLAGKQSQKGKAALIACAISSVLFSLAHYMGPEDFALYTFVFRTLAGAFFCALYWYRGFAVAVYTHAIYDVLVMVVIPIVFRG